MHSFKYSFATSRHERSPFPKEKRKKEKHNIQQTKLKIFFRFKLQFHCVFLLSHKPSLRNTERLDCAHLASMIDEHPVLS
eukprot:m.198366 g.198366  ORF g.198366 m.198366 type:complete len:80 (+) comp13685_c3_seq27:1310-1549(+)